MPAEYVREYCGHAGRNAANVDANLVECRDCGELVGPLAPGSGIVAGEDV
jgi:hypothetical protein